MIKVKEKKKSNDFVRLEREIKQLRSAFISIIGRDSEGEYRPAYVRRLLNLKNKKADRQFVSPEKFLEELGRV